MSYLAMQEWGGFEDDDAEHLLYCDHRGGIYKAGHDGGLVKIGCTKCVGCDCKASSANKDTSPDTAAQTNSVCSDPHAS